MFTTTHLSYRRKLLASVRISVILLALFSAFWLTLRHGFGDSLTAVRQQAPVATTPLQLPLQPATARANREIIRGLLLSAPVNGLGNWILRTSFEQTRTVLVLDIGALLDGILPTNSWVYVESDIQIGGLAVALSLRLDDYEPGEVAARLATGVPSTTIASQYNLTPIGALLASGNIFRFATNDPNTDERDLVQQMKQDPNIVWAELNYISDVPEGDPYKTWGWGGPDPSGYVNQAAFTQVNLSPALDQYRGDDTIIAILDTGIDMNHPGLIGHFLAGTDFVDDDDSAQDEGPGIGWGHGTHIAGIIAHMAPNSMLLPIRVLNVDGRGNLFVLSYAIEWAVAQGANVINLSLGTDYDSQTLSETIAAAQTQGVIFVAAAGNDNVGVAQYPVAYDGVIGVTALISDNRKADFANYGAWVELAAPGAGITSTIIGPDGSGYAVWSGTSMATAFVSGAAALARQKYPAASALEVEQLLTAHARNIDLDNPSYAGQLGGLLDVAGAIADPPTPTPTATATATPTPLLTPTQTPTPTPTTDAEANTPTPTATPSPSPTATGANPGGVSVQLYLPFVSN